MVGTRLNRRPSPDAGEPTLSWPPPSWADRSCGQIREKGEEDWTGLRPSGIEGFFSTDIWSAWDEESDESLLDAFQKEEEPRAPVPLRPRPSSTRWRSSLQHR